MIKRKLFNRFCIILGTICWIVGLLFIDAALAEEVITINPVTTPEPTPKPRPTGEVIEYQLEDSTKDLLAEFLWKSPADTTEKKEALIWLIFNRIDHGNPFNKTIEGNVTPSEFTFMSSHRFKLSDENLEIVQACYNQYRSYKDGIYTGKLPYPRNMYYCSFIDGGLYLFCELGGETVYACTEDVSR